MKLKNILYIFIFLIFFVNISAAAVSSFDDNTKTMTIMQGKNILFTVQLIDVKPDLITMTEIFKVVSYSNYQLNKNLDLNQTFNKISGQNGIVGSEWKILNNTTISKEVEDYGNITRTRETNTIIWDDKLNSFLNTTIIEEYQSYEVIGKHIKQEPAQLWENIPTTLNIVANQDYYLKLTYYKNAEINKTNILTIPSFFGFSAPQMTWWNNSWNYAIFNTISNGYRPFQMQLNISNSTGINNATHIFCNGHCNINFSDVRFVLDNTTALPYFIEDNTTGQFWVNLTGNGTVGLYYGNNNVITTSNGVTTFPLFMDFEGGSQEGMTLLQGTTLNPTSTLTAKTGIYSMNVYDPTTGISQKTFSAFTKPFRIVYWVYPTSTVALGQYLASDTAGSIVTTFENENWKYYSSGFFNLIPDKSVTINKWTRVENIFNTGNFDLFIENSNKGGVTYHTTAGNKIYMYADALNNLYTDTIFVSTLVGGRQYWGTWTSESIYVSTFNLKGYVKNIIEAPIYQARIDLNGTNLSFIDHKFTDISGYYIFSGISEDSYIVLTRQIGYRNNTTIMNINVNTWHNVTLNENKIPAVKITPGFDFIGLFVVFILIGRFRKY